jgi:hypothetical protein
MFSLSLILIYVGAPTYVDNIAFYYLPFALREYKIPCIIYASDDFDKTLLLADTDWLPFKRIENAAAFERSLRLDLSAEMAGARNGESFH